MKVFVLVEKYEAYGDKWDTIQGVYTNPDRARFELVRLEYEKKKYDRFESDYELQEHELINDL